MILAEDHILWLASRKKNFERTSFHRKGNLVFVSVLYYMKLQIMKSVIIHLNVCVFSFHTSLNGNLFPNFPKWWFHRESWTFWKSFTQDSSVKLKFESQGSKPYSFFNVAISICNNENRKHLNNSNRNCNHRVQ